MVSIVRDQITEEAGGVGSELLDGGIGLFQSGS
jgi:hypothetical protein